MTTTEEVNVPGNVDNHSQVVHSPKAKKMLVAIITASLCAVLLIAGLSSWLSAQAREQTTDAYVTGHIDLVSARVPGTVQSVKVDDNQIVGKDDVLVQLDPNDLQMRVALAKAGLDAAEQLAATAKTAITFSSQSAAAGNTQADAGVGQAEAGVRQAEAGVRQAEASVARSQDMLRQADADAERAALDDKRFESLLARHEVSQQQYDHMHAGYKIALANNGAAKAGVREAEAALARATGGVQAATRGVQAATGGVQAAHAALTDVDLKGKQYQSALANVEAAQAAYADARLQLSYTVIHASAGGRIGNKTVEVGQRVQPGQPLLAVVEPEVWVVANFKETQLAQVESGQPVEVTIDRFPEKRFVGRVQSFSPATGANFSLLPPENATGNFVKIVQRVPVKIALDPDSVHGYEARLVPGLSAVVTVRSR